MSEFDQTLQQPDEERERQRQISQGEAPAPPQVAGYELYKPLGEGAFGAVWGGVQLRTGQKVAVKLLKGGPHSNWNYFNHELERLREVAEHPGIVTLLDADLSAQPPYFVMPWLQKGSLARLAEPPSPAQAVIWFREIAAALHYTHGKGLLHCDLKPSNVLLDQEGHLRLVDFGQSRLASDHDGAFGTFGYMAPEQAGLGAEAGPSVGWDIYALGATIYQLLGGRCPRISEDDRTELSKASDLSGKVEAYRNLLLSRPLIPLRQLNPKVDKELATIVESCLALDPARRPSSTHQLLEDLERRERREPLLCRRPWSWGYRLERMSRRPLIVASFLLGLTMLLVVSSSAIMTRAANRRLASNNRELQLQLCQIKTERGTSLAAQDPQQAVLWWAAALDALPPEMNTVARNLRVRIRYHLAYSLAWNRIQTQRSYGMFSADGKRLLNVRNDEEPEVLDTQTGKQLLLLKGRYPHPSTQALAISPDGTRYAALVKGSHLEAWGQDGGSLARLPLQHDVLALDFAGANQLRAVLSNGDSLSWEIGGASKVLSNLGGPLQWAQLDGPRVCVRTTSAGVQIRDVATGRQLGADFVTSLDPRVEGHQLALARGNEARVYDLNGRAVGPPLQHPGEVKSLALSPDQKMLATTCADRTLRIWDLPSGIQRFTRAYTTDSLGLAFSTDSKLLAQSCADGKTRLWEVGGGTLADLLRNHQGSSLILFSPDGKHLSLFGDTGELSVRERLSPPQRQVRFSGAIHGLAFTHGSRLLVGGSFGLQAVDIGSLQTRSLSELQVESLRLSPDGSRVFLRDAQNRSQVVDAADGRVVYSPTDRWAAADFSRDGNEVWGASQSSDFLVRVDLHKGSSRAVRDGLTSPTSVVRLGGESLVAAAYTNLDNGLIGLWKVGQRVGEFQLAHERVGCLEFNDDRSRLAAGGSGGVVVLWDAREGKELARIHHTQAITDLVFGRGGFMATSSLDGTVRVCRADNGKPLFNELAHNRRDAVRCLAFGPDGGWLASGCDDHTARVWETQTGLLVTGWLAHSDKVTALAFSRDGKILASADEGGTLHLWSLDVEDVADLTRATGMELLPESGSIRLKSDG